MNRPMDYVGQFNVQGTPTFAFHCMGCNGKAHLQHYTDQRTGQVGLRQVQLTGNHNEYRPNSIRPTEQVKIPVAYTLGHSSSAQASRVRTGAAAPLPVAYSLDPNQDPRAVVSPRDPMHPANLRERIAPWRLDELGAY